MLRKNLLKKILSFVLVFTFAFLNLTIENAFAAQVEPNDLLVTQQIEGDNDASSNEKDFKQRSYEATTTSDSSLFSPRAVTIFSVYASGDTVNSVLDTDDLQAAINAVPLNNTEFYTIHLNSEYSDNGTSSYIIDNRKIKFTSAPGGPFTFTKTDIGRHFQVGDTGSSELILENVVIDGGSNDGGIYAINDSKLTIEAGTYIQNIGNSNYIQADGNSILTINGGEFTNNTGTLVKNGGSFTITGGTVSNNNGSISINNTVLDMTGGTISDNNTTGFGAGVILDASTFNMTGGTISGNSTTQDGGAIAVTSNSTFNLSGTATITDNSAKKGGAIVAYVGNNVNINGGSITNNTATEDGGGIYAYTNSSVNVTGGTISGNTATIDGGGIWVGSFATEANPDPAAKYLELSVTGGTISGNIASKTFAPPVNKAEFAGFGDLINNADIVYKPTDFINYDANDGSNRVFSVQAVVGDNAVSDYMFDLTNFVEWNTQPDGTGDSYAPGSTFTKDATNPTLYAIYAYTVTYHNGAESVDVVVYQDGGAFNHVVLNFDATELNFSKGTYSFGGWSETPDGALSTVYDNGNTVDLTSDVDLYARWGSVISYWDDSVPSLQEVIVEEGNSHVVGDVVLNPVKGDYVVFGKDSSGTNLYAENEVITPTGNITIEVFWKNKVIYNSNNGSNESTSAIVDLGGSYIIEDNTNFVYGDYTFKAWSSEETGDIITTFEVGQEITPTNNVELFARWISNLTYTDGTTTNSFEINAGDSHTVEIPFEVTLQENETAVLVDQNGNIYNVGDTFVPTADTTLTVQINKGFPVTYNSNNGENTSFEVAVGENETHIVLENTDFVNGNYTFKGWSTEATGDIITLYEPGQEIVVTEGVNLYARWVLNITYNDGNEDITVEVDYGDDFYVEVPDVLNPDGRIPVIVDQDGNEYQEGDKIDLDDDIQLQVKLSRQAIYHSNVSGSSETIRVNADKDGNITIDENTFTNGEYVFVSWNTAADGSGTEYMSAVSTVITEDLNLYAIWDIDTDTDTDTGTDTDDTDDSDDSDHIIIDTEDDEEEEEDNTDDAITDTNGDGVIDIDDVTDTNGDGVIDLDDITDDDGNFLLDLDDVTDTNGDGKITIDDITDKNDDGEITLDDLTDLDDSEDNDNNGGLTDTNGDGVIDLDDATDTNGNGVIDLDDITDDDGNFLLDLDNVTDTNGDGKITVDDIIDTNGDGEINIDDILNDPNGLDNLTDNNGDYVVDLSDLPDTNNDDTINSSDLVDSNGDGLVNIYDVGDLNNDDTVDKFDLGDLNDDGVVDNKDIIHFYDLDGDGSILNKTDNIAYFFGYEDENQEKFAKPDEEITRAEAVMFLYRLLENDNIPTSTESNFNDVQEGEWYVEALNSLLHLEIVNGYEDGSFRPNDFITRAEFSALVYRLELNMAEESHNFIDVTSEHWADNIISAVYGEGWVNGYEDETFKPENKITRAETVSVINRVINRDASNVSMNENPYSDINEEHWAFEDIMAATTYNK